MLRKTIAFFRNHWAFLAAFFIGQVTFLWMVTYGTWEVFAPESFGQFYDYQAKSILQGRLDVPLEAIEAEAFILGNKYYGYFGITPSLLRIPLIFLFPEEVNKFSRAFMILWSGVTLLVSYLILLTSMAWAQSGRENIRLSSALALGFILAVGLGSTNIFLASRGFIYHEAIFCEVALALCAILFVLKFCMTLQTNLLFWALLAASFSFLSRPIAGLSAMATLLFPCFFFLLAAFFFKKDVRLSNKRWAEIFSFPDHVRERIFSRIPLIILLAGFVIMIHFAINYAKFRSFDIPMKYYGQFIQDPARFTKIDGKLTHLVNIPFNFYHYFLIFNLKFTSSWPYVGMGLGNLKAFPEAKIDVIEPFVSIPVGMPALFLLSIGGFVFLGKNLSKRKNFFLPFALAILSLSGTSILMVNDAVTYRYLHDFLPAWVFSGAFGVTMIRTARKKSARRVVSFLFWILCLISCYNNIMFSLTYQRLFIWGVEERYRDEFLRWQRHINGLFAFQKVPHLASGVGKGLPCQSPPTEETHGAA